jgi:hypothetical protein
MDNAARKAQLEKQLEKAKELAKKRKDAVKALENKIKELDTPKQRLTHKQQNTIKIWHGIACLALIEEDRELQHKVRAYLEKNVKSAYQRKLMGLSIPEAPATAPATDKKAVLATERVNLVVPYPEPASEREAAKAAGARWDSAARVWYVEAGFDLVKVERWLPPNIDLKNYALI